MFINILEINIMVVFVSMTEILLRITSIEILYTMGLIKKSAKHGTTMLKRKNIIIYRDWKTKQWIQ